MTKRESRNPSRDRGLRHRGGLQTRTKRMAARNEWALRFADLLLLRGISQNKLAKDIGVSATQLSRWLNNFPPSKRDSLRKILLGLITHDLPTEGFVRSALEYGGKQATSMQILIGEGLVKAPGKERHDQLTITEAAMRPEMLLDETIAWAGFARDPFGEPRDNAEVFKAQKNIKALRGWLEQATLRGEQIMAVLGEPGSGKTTTVYDILDELEANYGVRKIILNNTDKKHTSASTIQTAILSELDDLKKFHSEREIKARYATSVLKRERAQGQRLLLVIDEAHDLTLDMLHSLKRLHEMRDGFKKLLTILLVGQPEFYGKIANPGVREFSLRCKCKDYPGLSKAEPFLRFRFRQAGASDAGIDRIIPAPAWKAFEAKCNMLRDEVRGKSALTPLAAQNLMARALNYAAKVDDGPLSPEHVEHVQDK